jgi:hypothetical protein
MIVSMLIRLSGTSAGVGFNLAISLLFALTALAAYGVLFDLLAAKGEKERADRKAIFASSAGWALLAPLFILLVSNLAGFLDILHARGIFWGQAADGIWNSGFWKWLAIKEFDVAPPLPFSWAPTAEVVVVARLRVLQDFIWSVRQRR